jgi:nitrogen fixation protein
MNMNDKLGWLWWICLLIISTYNTHNIFDFYLKNQMSPFQKKITLLSIVYTIVCGVRAFFPKKDLARICFFDNKLSYPIFGRTIATIAELSYIKLIILILLEIVKDIDSYVTINSFVPYILEFIFPIIVIAQSCSWTGVITKNNTWNAIEESIWMISFAILTLITLFLYFKILNISNPQIDKIKNLLIIAIIAGIVFVTFMYKVDVPMYLNRWHSSKEKTLGLIDGLKDMCQCKKVTKSYDIWKSEIPWQTGYFSFAVWSSILLVKWFNDYSKL